VWRTPYSRVHGSGAVGAAVGRAVVGWAVGVRVVGAALGRAVGLAVGKFVGARVKRSPLRWTYTRKFMLLMPPLICASGKSRRVPAREPLMTMSHRAALAHLPSRRPSP
jgi:hypothetical protein